MPSKVWEFKAMTLSILSICLTALFLVGCDEIPKEITLNDFVFSNDLPSADDVHKKLSGVYRLTRIDDIFLTDDEGDIYLFPEAKGKLMIFPEHTLYMSITEGRTTQVVEGNFAAYPDTSETGNIKFLSTNTRDEGKVRYFTYSILDNMLLLTEYGIRVITAKTLYWQKIP